jgi:hypothetical protein
MSDCLASDVFGGNNRVAVGIVSSLYRRVEQLQSESFMLVEHDERTDVNRMRRHRRSVHVKALMALTLFRAMRSLPHSERFKQDCLFR